MGEIIPDIITWISLTAGLQQQTVIDGILALLVIVVGLVIQKTANWILGSMGGHLSQRIDGRGRSRVIIALQKPLSFFIVILGFYAAVHLFPLSPAAEMIAVKTLRSMVAVLILWWIYNLGATRSGYIEYLLENTAGLDQALIQIILKTIKVLIVIIGIVIIAREWNYDLNALVAGLGLGGLALALAAKDTIANLFGGVIILTEKPFAIGDWVQTRNVEGVVENISFRSTRFRTFTQALVTVPNYVLTNDAITNWSRMGKRRIDFYLPLAFSTPSDSVHRVVEKIRTMLEEHEEIHPDTILVYFERFSPNSLDVFVYCFTASTDWDKHLSAKEDINYKILAILDDENVSFSSVTRGLVIDTHPLKGPSIDKNQ